MKITGSTRDGRFVQIDIELTETIKNAKKMIAKKEGISYRRIVLRLNGTILNEKKTMDDYQLDRNIFDIVYKTKKPSIFSCCKPIIVN